MRSFCPRRLIVLFAVLAALIALVLSIKTVSDFGSPPPYRVFDAQYECFGVSPDENRIFLFTVDVGSSSFVFRVVDIETQSEVLSETCNSDHFGNAIPTAFFSNDSKKLGLHFSPGRVVLLYDLEKKCLVAELPGWDDAFFDKNGRLITRSYKTLWDVDRNVKVGEVDWPFDDELEARVCTGPVFILGLPKAVTKIVDARRNMTAIGHLAVKFEGDLVFSVTSSRSHMGHVEKSGEFVLVDNSSATTKRIELPAPTHFTEISPDGSMIATAAPRSERLLIDRFLRGVLLRDKTHKTSLIGVDSGQEVIRLPGQNAKNGSMFSEHGSLVLTYDADSEKVMIWQWPIKVNWIPCAAANFIVIMTLGLVFRSKFKAHGR